MRSTDSRTSLSMSARSSSASASYVPVTEVESDALGGRVRRVAAKAPRGLPLADQHLADRVVAAARELAARHVGPYQIRKIGMSGAVPDLADDVAPVQVRRRAVHRESCHPERPPPPTPAIPTTAAGVGSFLWATASNPPPIAAVALRKREYASEVAGLHPLGVTRSTGGNPARGAPHFFALISMCATVLERSSVARAMVSMSCARSWRISSSDAPRVRASASRSTTSNAPIARAVSKLRAVYPRSMAAVAGALSCSGDARGRSSSFWAAQYSPSATLRTMRGVGPSTHAFDTMAKAPSRGGVRTQPDDTSFAGYFVARAAACAWSVSCEIATPPATTVAIATATRPRRSRRRARDVDRLARDERASAPPGVDDPIDESRGAVAISST